MDAQRLQYLVYSPQFGAGAPSTILLYQQTPFWELRRRIGRIGEGYNQAIMEVYSSDYRGPAKICELVAHFGPEVDVGESDFIMDNVPGYLRDMYENSVTRPFLWQPIKPCLEQTRQELAKSLTDAAQIFGQLQRAFSLYIDRQCTTDSCIIQFGTYDLAATLPEKEYLKTASLTNERASVYTKTLGNPSVPKEITPVDSAVCRITDPDGKLISEFTGATDAEFKSPWPNEPNKVTTHFTMTRQPNETFLRIHADDLLDGAKLIKTQGFYQLPNGFEGLLQKGSTDSISAQVSVGEGGDTSIIWENDLKFEPPREYGKFNIECHLK